MGNAMAPMGGQKPQMAPGAPLAPPMNNPNLPPQLPQMAMGGKDASQPPAGGDSGLMDLLMRRKMGPQGEAVGQMAPEGMMSGMMGGAGIGAMGKMMQGAAGPTSLPSAPKHLPPAWQRFATAQKMQEGYKNNWQPNPMLTQALEGGQ